MFLATGESVPSYEDLCIAGSVLCPFPFFFFSIMINMNLVLDADRA